MLSDLICSASVMSGSSSLLTSSSTLYLFIAMSMWDYFEYDESTNKSSCQCKIEGDTHCAYVHTCKG